MRASEQLPARDSWGPPLEAPQVISRVSSRLLRSQRSGCWIELQSRYLRSWRNLLRRLQPPALRFAHLEITPPSIPTTFATRPTAVAANHSFSLDHRRRPETLRTAMATAFFWPTRTTRRFPRVTPV